MTLKRMTVILLCLTMAAALLVGCAQSNGAATNAPANTSAGTQAPVKTDSAGETSAAVTDAPAPLGKYEDPIVITLARSAYTGENIFDESDPEKKSLAENRWISAYEEYLGIRIEFKWISADGDADTAKWSTGVASGDVPDAAMVGDSIYKMLLEGGLIADMTDCYDQYASPDYKSYISDSMYQQMWYDGGLRGLPYSSQGYIGSSLLFVRQDWLDAVDMDAPTTLDAVVETAKAFQQAQLGGTDTIGLMFDDKSGGSRCGNWDGFMNAYGAYLDYWLVKDGQIVYSNVQDEMKDALLAMQALYTDGVMNKDFAVATQEVTDEYVASGKAGLFYGTSYATVSPIAPLCDSDENAEIINLYPPSLSGEPMLIQTATPSVRRIFVSSACQNPEAIVKIVNLSLELAASDYSNYWISDEGFLWFKFLPFGDNPLRATNDIDGANAIRVAEQTGKAFEAPNASSASWYENYQKAKTGESESWWLTTMGEGGSYTTLYDAYHAGLLLENAYVGLPTATMDLKGDIISDELNTAMLEVIMGADISVYETAIEGWYGNGGQDILDELNEWYQSLS